MSAPVTTRFDAPQLAPASTRAPGRIETPAEVAARIWGLLGTLECPAWEQAIATEVGAYARRTYDLARAGEDQRLAARRELARALLTFAGVPLKGGCPCGAQVWRVQDVIARCTQSYDVDLNVHTCPPKEPRP